MHNRPTQLARRWGPGPHPWESGDEGLQSVAICTLILSAQESAPLLAEGNTCPYFPKNNEQDCFNRTYLGTTFLSYFTITLGGRQKISSCLCFCLLFSSQHNSSGLTGNGAQLRAHRASVHFLICTLIAVSSWAI